MNANCINSIGLFLDILGVVLLFIYGLPKDMAKDGHQFITANPTDESVRKYKLYNRLSYVALAMLIIGFLLQIVSNWVA